MQLAEGWSAIQHALLTKQPFVCGAGIASRPLRCLLARTAQQDAEENVVLEQAAVVEEARRKEAALRKAAAQPARPRSSPDPSLQRTVKIVRSLHIQLPSASWSQKHPWPAGGDEGYRVRPPHAYLGVGAVLRISSSDKCARARHAPAEGLSSATHHVLQASVSQQPPLQWAGGVGRQARWRQQPPWRCPPAVPEVQEPGTCSLLDADVAPHWPAKPGVYVRGAFTRQMGAQQLARMSGGTRCSSGATQLACGDSDISLYAVLLVLERLCDPARILG